MIVNILSIIAALTAFFVIKYAVWYWTEGQKQYPSFLEYKPWCCRKCLGFWTLMTFFIVMWLVFDLPLMAAVGCPLAILDTIAIIIDEKNKYQL